MRDSRFGVIHLRNNGISAINVGKDLIKANFANIATLLQGGIFEHRAINPTSAVVRDLVFPSTNSRDATRIQGPVRRDDQRRAARRR